MHNIYKSIRSRSYSVPCELCSLGPALCIPMLLNNNLNDIVKRKQAFAKNQIIINEGSTFLKLYIIHSGAVKTYVTINGNKQINGFYLPGDIIGLDSFNTKKYNNTVETLTETFICEISFDELMQVVMENHCARDMLFNLMSEEILNYQKLILCYSQKKAEEKLATFIYSLYLRYAHRGHTSLNLKLAMSRNDIANYLGLTIETISRILTHMQELNILFAKGKYITIKNLSALIEIAENNK